MPTNFTEQPNLSGNISGPIGRYTGSEWALWRYAIQYADDRSGIWIDAGYADYDKPDPYLYASASDDPNAFVIIDRIGDREFTSGLSARHPVAMIDIATGKRCLLLGAGGAGANALTNNINGDIDTTVASIYSGLQNNRLPLWQSGRGFSIAFAVRIPAAGQTINNTAFGLTGGGVVLGGEANSGSPFITIDNTTGKLAYFDGANAIFSTGDYRNGNILKVVLTFDVSTNRANMWIGDGSGAADFTQIMGDLPSGDASYPRIGGFGKTTLNGQLRGFLFGLTYLPAPVFNDDAARAAAFAWLTERSA